MSGPGDCSGSMERRAGRQAHPRSSKTQGRSGTRPPPQLAPYASRQVETYKGQPLGRSEASAPHPDPLPASGEREKARCARDPQRDTLQLMFTGVISDIGTVAARDGGRFAVRCAYPAAGIALGASIACDGACLQFRDRHRTEPTPAAPSRSTSPTRRCPRPRSATGRSAAASTWSGR